MRAYLPDYQCSSAKSLSEALRLLEKGARPIAGGTDIMVLFDAGLLAPGDYVDILGLSELKGITQKKEYADSWGVNHLFGGSPTQVFTNKFSDPL